MKPALKTDHVIMFYSKPEDKREVLFTYLKAGLDQGEAAEILVVAHNIWHTYKMREPGVLT